MKRSWILLLAVCMLFTGCGRKADKIRKLYNGKLECGYYSFLGEKPPRSAYNENFGSKSDKQTDFLKEKDNKLVE